LPLLPLTEAIPVEIPYVSDVGHRCLIFETHISETSAKLIYELITGSLLVQQLLIGIQKWKKIPRLMLAKI